MPALRLSVIISVLFLMASALSANKKPPGAPVNLNTASGEQLQLVPGIGPATADKILQMRKAYGAFKSVDDLLAVRGIGPKRLEKMRKYLTVGKAGAKANAGASHGTSAAGTAPAAKTGTASAAAGAPPTKAGGPPAKTVPPAKPAASDDDPPCLR